MKYYFVLNPVSGRKDHSNSFLRLIRDTAERLGIDYEIYFTRHSGDADDYIRRVCRESGNICEDSEPLRFYGIGGDGTVNEMVNGAYGFPNVEVGVIPQGTGNDYIRNYGSQRDFTNIEKQILGESVPSDLIRYRAEYKGEITERYCANMFNIGFDCNVVDTTNRVKEWRGFNGSAAYLTSVFMVLAKKKETSLRVEYGDGTLWDGNVLLLSIANGCFCGGGIKGTPRADLRDGLMDVSLVKGGVTRSYFVKLFPKYMKGTHLEDKRTEGVIDYRHEKTLKVTANDESLRLCVDGEISTQKSVEFEVVRDAIRFIVPKGAKV